MVFQRFGCFGLYFRFKENQTDLQVLFSVGNSTVHLNVKTRSKEVEFTLALTHGTSLSPTATTSIVSVWQGNQLEKFLVVAVGKQC